MCRVMLGSIVRARARVVGTGALLGGLPGRSRRVAGGGNGAKRRGAVLRGARRVRARRSLSLNGSSAVRAVSGRK